MPSEQHGGVRESKRKSHFRILTKEYEEKRTKVFFGEGEFDEDISSEQVWKYYDREHYYWFVRQNDDCLYVGLKNRNETNEDDMSDTYVAAFGEWSQVEDCDDPDAVDETQKPMWALGSTNE